MRCQIGRSPAQRLLLAVCAGYAVAGLLLVPPTLGLGWDEIVYVSQYGSHAPPAFFSAPRSRGVPLLTAPITALTDSTPALRVALTLLSAIALYLGFRPWLRLGPRPAAVPLAAALYGGLWITLFYSGSAMPNHYTAMAATAATGCLLLAVRDRARPGRPTPDRTAAPAPAPGTTARSLRFRPSPTETAPFGPLLAAETAPEVTAPAPAPAPGPAAGSASGPAPAPAPAAARPRWALPGTAAALAVAGLMRPSDAVWIGLPLVAAALLVPSWRRASPFASAAVLGGLAVGTLPWIVEAELRFGGLRERLYQAQQIQGGTHFTFTLPKVLAAGDGPLLCRPCSAPMSVLVSPVALWWWAPLACAALGTAAARRSGRAATAWLPLAVAASSAVTYLVLIDYTAPRFLLPSYALVCLPAAVGLLRLVPAAGPRPPLRAALLAAVLLGYAAVQTAVAHRTARVQAAARDDWAELATALHQAGINPPCVVTGVEAIPVAYYTRCRALEVLGNNINTTPAGLLAATHRLPTALVLRGGSPPPWAHGWTGVPARTGYRQGWRILLPPWTPVRPG